MKGYILETDELSQGLRELWARFLDGDAAAVMVLTESEGGLVTYGLVSSRDMVGRTKALSPYLPENGARLLQRLTRLSPPSGKVAAVLRPCEVRACVELVKLNQVSTENLVLVSLDCLGTYPFDTYRERPDESLPDQKLIRDACKACLYPVSPWADVRVGYIGVQGGILVEAVTEKGKEFLEGVGLELRELDIPERGESLEAILKERVSEEKKLLDEARNYKGEGLIKALSACIKCMNCMEMCPICYCKECFFRSTSLDMEGDRFLDLARSRGAVRLPTDILLFHLTRMSHMAFSCVSCGICQDVCPRDVPVFRFFKLVSKEVQEMFNYRAGENPEEEPPSVVFREDEFKEVEES